MYKRSFIIVSIMFHIEQRILNSPFLGLRESYGCDLVASTWGIGR
jgi:hypothetical protein